MVLVALLWLALFMFLALWWPFCSSCFVLSCVVSGHSNFVTFWAIFWVFWVVSHSDWSSWAVGSSAAALRSHVVPVCGITAMTSFTWCVQLFCGSNSCLSCFIIDVVTSCGVLLFCLANKLLWYAGFVSSSGFAAGASSTE